MSESPSTESDAVARNILIASTTLAGLMVLEYTRNFHFEVQVIRRWRFWKSADATIFVIARYVGLAGQIFNIWVANRMASGIPSPPRACRAWFAYMTVMIQTLTISVEALLMLRVCAMYHNDKYVLRILFVFAGTQAAVMAVSARMAIPYLGISPTCMVVGSHPGQIYAGASTIAVHLCLLAMILWQYFRGSWREPLRSYLKILVRDSIGTVIAVTGSYLIITLSPMGLPRSQMSRNIHFHVTLFIFWLAAGRLFLNKEKFRQELEDDLEITEIDLDHLEPLDHFDMPATPSDTFPLQGHTDSSSSLSILSHVEDIAYDRVRD